MAAKKAATAANKRNWAPGAKEAAASKRREHRVVADYLAALEQAKTYRRRPRARDVAEGELQEILAKIEETSGIDRLVLTQRKFDIEAELEDSDLAMLEEQFIEVAWNYAARKGISWSAFREVGVSASVLRKAGF